MDSARWYASTFLMCSVLAVADFLFFLSQTPHANVTVILLSSMPWDYLRPIPSLFPDPVYLSITAFSEAGKVSISLAHNKAGS